MSTVPFDAEAALPAAAHVYLPRSGSVDFSVLSYDLDLSYKVATNRLDATAVIQARANVQLTAISLDLVHLRAKRVKLDGDKRTRFTQSPTHLRVVPTRPIAAGAEFTLEIAYDGSPAPRRTRWGTLGWEELSDGVIVAAQPSGAPTWFPCNDRPSDKASYSISVTTQPGYVAVCNGVLVAHTVHGSAETWVYEQEEPMATYLATVQIGRYVMRPLAASVPMAVAVSPSARGVDAAFGRQPEMLRAFESMFGPYPFPTYTAVVTDDELEIPLESQSLSTFGVNFLTSDWRLNRLVAHELAHQWFGNAVTLREWKDIWLHEGFACYAEWLWSERAGLGSADEHARSHHGRLASLRQDLLLADPGPDLMFDDRVYKRGALLLHALRLTIGDDLFFSVLRTWVARFSGASVTTADFVALVAEVAGDRSALFEAWLFALPLPELPPVSA